MILQKALEDHVPAAVHASVQPAPELAPGLKRGTTDCRQDPLLLYFQNKLALWHWTQNEGERKEE